MGGGLAHCGDIARYACGTQCSGDGEGVVARGGVIAENRGDRGLGESVNVSSSRITEDRSMGLGVQIRDSWVLSRMELGKVGFGDDSRTSDSLEAAFSDITCCSSGKRGKVTIEDIAGGGSSEFSVGPTSCILR